jgi:hypothetical protein
MVGIKVNSNKGGTYTDHWMHQYAAFIFHVIFIIYFVVKWMQDKIDAVKTITD